MLIFGLMYALVIGIAIAWIWSRLFNTHGPWNSFFWFFVVIFLFSWGGGSWITPFGPTGWGIAWVPFLCMGFFMALLLTAATPRDRRHQARSWSKLAGGIVNKKHAASEKAIETSFDVFFWLLIIVMVSFVFSRSVWPLRTI